MTDICKLQSKSISDSPSRLSHNGEVLLCMNHMIHYEPQSESTSDSPNRLCHNDEDWFKSKRENAHVGHQPGIDDRYSLDNSLSGS